MQLYFSTDFKIKPMKELLELREHIETRISELLSLPQTTVTVARINELMKISVWAGEKLLNRLNNKPKQTEFKCYEILTVQSRMFGCTEQCAECQAKELTS